MGLLWNPLWNSIVIGFVSAFFCILFGWLGAIGFVKLSVPWQTKLELPLIWGGFVPALYVSLGLMNLVDDFPFGLTAIVVAHVSMNIGWLMIKISQRIRTQMNGLQELAFVEGAGAMGFWCGPGIRFLFPSMINQFRVVFALCFGSFVIPLILGGPRWATLEVAVYREVRASGPSWILAVMLLIQFSVVMVLGRGESEKSARTSESLRVTPVAFGSRWYFILPACLAVIGFVGVFVGLGPKSVELRGIWTSKVWTSGVALFLYSSFLWIGVLLWTWFRPSGKLLRFWMGLGAISPIALGFLLVWCASHLGMLPFSDNLALVLGTLAYSCLILPAMLKMELQDDLLRLRSQVDVAESLGGDRFRIWKQILLPQLLPQMGRLVGIGAFWGMGEVALIGLLSKSDQTLALEAQALMGAYRLEAATGIVLLSLAMGGIGYFLNRGVANVRY